MRRGLDRRSTGDGPGTTGGDAESTAFSVPDDTIGDLQVVFSISLSFMTELLDITNGKVIVTVHSLNLTYKT